MNVSQRVTGIAAFVQGTALAVLLVCIGALLPRVGITGSDLFTPAKILPAIHSPVLLLFYGLFLSFGVTLLLIVLGMTDRMHNRERSLMRIATLVAVAGLLMYASFGLVGIWMIVAAGQAPNAAALVATALGVLHVLFALGPLAAITTLLWAWAAAKTHSLPAALCALVIVASLLRLATIFTQQPILAMLQLGGSAAWGWWLGIALLQRRGNHAAVGARATA
jgi:hypothetical protein